MKQKEIFLGCSSFSNRKWIGIFYPENLLSKEWFAYYCTHFKTYEVNATFYKSPTSKSLQTWYKKSPDGFIFSVKAPKQITHIKKFVECEREINDFYVACREGLENKLGCVLFQLPPSFHYTSERLKLIINNLSPDFKNVIEFRNKSWWTQEVYDALTQNKLVFCSVNYPGLPTTIIETSSTGYIRLHGNPELFYSKYNAEELSKTYDEIRGAKKLKEVFIYFNNTASTAGILNALAFKQVSVASPL